MDPASTSNLNSFYDNWHMSRSTTYTSYSGSQTLVGWGWAPNYISSYSCPWGGGGGCSWYSHLSANYSWHVKLKVYGAAQAYAWWGLSDGRFKEHISTIPSAISLVKKMRGVTYDWKKQADNYDDNIKQYGHGDYVREDGDGQATGFRSDLGVIAQELKEVLPMAVMEEEDKDSSGTVIGTHFAVNYDNIIPVLIEAIKEQQVQIEELQRLAGIEPVKVSSKEDLITAMQEKAAGMSAEEQLKINELIEAIEEGGVEVDSGLRYLINEFLTKGVLPNNED